VGSDPRGPGERVASRKRHVLVQSAQSALRNSLELFVSQLYAIPASGSPDAVHQTRIGWRKFKSAIHLYKPVLCNGPPAGTDRLRELLALLGRQRDIEVARHQTLPGLRANFVAGDAGRAKEWKQMALAIAHADRRGSKALHAALQSSDVASSISELQEWLDGLSSREEKRKEAAPDTLRHWARHRVTRLHGDLKSAIKDGLAGENLHRVRILAKRLRYGIEAVHDVLPQKLAKRWHAEAVQWQSRIGASRDLWRARTLAEELHAQPSIVMYLKSASLQPMRGPQTAETGGKHPAADPAWGADPGTFAPRNPKP